MSKASGHVYTTEDSFAFRAIYPLVERPSRYVDSELNLASAGYREGFFNVLLVFPDVYEIGASHQGLRLLYHRLASMEGVGVEFAFAPWPDAERLMLATGETLRSSLTQTPAKRFDLIGFSLTHELNYTNLLMMLNLAGMSLEASQRREDDPIVVVGGPCSSNPLPFLPAVDAVFVGDAEDSLSEAVISLKRLVSERASRRSRIESLASIEGVYVDGISNKVIARVHRFESGELPLNPIVPVADIVHQRLSVEIMRGCSRGCRFCLAGMYYRPCRERSVEDLVEAIMAGLDATGWDEVSLLSLSTSDYSRLEELLEKLCPELERRRVSLSLPSLRPETITDSIVAASSIVTRSGFTIAPEAGTERLRRVIGKEFSDADIVEGARKIISAGFQNLKLYFMIGLPTERDEDLLAIGRLVREILSIPRSGRRFSLGISVSPFVPKPHTPFQWERQCSMEELREKQKRISSSIKSRFTNLSQRDVHMSIVEGILARGDRRLWNVLRIAFSLGCRFDAWTGSFRFELWERALSEVSLSIEKLVEPRSAEEDLPWDFVELNAKKKFLLRERERALSESEKGIADKPLLSKSLEIKGSSPMTAASTGDGRRPSEREERASERKQSSLQYFRYRFQYEKTCRARFLSHIETFNAIQRAIRRSGWPVCYSEGYHPHPRISAGPALAVGMEGEAEFFDVEMQSPIECAPEVLNSSLPQGIRIVACEGPFSRAQGKLPPSARFSYRIDFSTVGFLVGAFAGKPSSLAAAGFPELSDGDRIWYSLAIEISKRNSEALRAFAEAESPARFFERFWRKLFDEEASLRSEKGIERSCSDCIVARCSDDLIEVVIPAREGCVRPQDLLAAVAPKELSLLAKVRRTEIHFSRNGTWMTPLELVRNL